MSDLKSCPFCGCDKIKFVERTCINGGSYDCVECGCSTEYKQTQEQALAAWNTRAESPELSALREQVKVLREALEYGRDELGMWMSAALEDSKACNEFRSCINEWMNKTFAALDQTKPKDGE